MIAVALLMVGAALVLWGREFDGWDQSWRVEVGAAIGLLAPLYFAEELLRSRLAELSRLASESAMSYGLIRRVLPAGGKRTAVLDSLVDGVRDHASAGGFTSRDIQALIGGDSHMRTVALGAMQGRHALIDEGALVESIARSETGFEQYHALLLAVESWPQRSEDTRHMIIKAIERDREGFIADDPERAALAARIRELSEAGP